MRQIKQSVTIQWKAVTVAILAALTVAILAALVLRSCGLLMPPLLRNVTASGGYWGACPPISKTDVLVQTTSPLALSPELQQRLEKEFPPGTAESKIVSVLTDQGFSDIGQPCKNEKTIRSATYNESKKEAVAPLFAVVYWKVDRGNKLVWTKGFVAYDGL